MANHDELIYKLDELIRALRQINNTLFDTLGSGKTGDALNSMPRIANALEDLNENLIDANEREGE